jgi:hypothetical protein
MKKIAEITRSYRTDIEEHVVTAPNGYEIATAHKLAGGMWSLKIGKKFMGIVPNEETVIAHLDKVVIAARKTAQHAA